MDILDEKILTLLSEKNYTNKQLSTKLKKKPEMIAAHIKDMIFNNVINGFYYVVDFDKLGYKQIKMYF